MPLRVTAHQRMPGGEEAQNVFHFAGSVGDGVVVEQLADLVQDFYDNIKSVLSNQWSLYQIDVADRDDQSAPPVGPWGTYASFDVESLSGGTTGQYMPNDCAVMIGWRSQVAPAGRGGRGRTFIGGLPASALSSNGGAPPAVVVSTTTDHFGTYAAQLIADAPGGHEFSLLRSSGATSPILGGYVSNRWATQKRRDRETPETRRLF